MATTGFKHVFHGVSKGLNWVKQQKWRLNMGRELPSSYFNIAMENYSCQELRKYRYTVNHPYMDQLPVHGENVCLNNMAELE